MNQHRHRSTDQASGAVHTWRLTVFTDGSCGLAVDGVPLARTVTPISFDWPLRLWISGQSLRTDIAVGALTIWQGDPGGVDWERLALQPPPHGGGSADGGGSAGPPR